MARLSVACTTLSFALITAANGVCQAGATTTFTINSTDGTINGAASGRK
jgi:hypothetical protein